MAAEFSQQYCHVVPTREGGMLIAGRNMHSCLVEVSEGMLTIIEAPDSLIARGPVAGLEIATPALQRRVGTATILVLDRNWWSIDFARVGEVERVKSSGLGGKLATAFGAGTLKTARHGKELNTAFVAVLLSQGATDRRAAH